MSFTYKKRRSGKEYLYFKAGGKGPYYIAPKDSPSTANIANVKKALEYMQLRMGKDKEIYERLIAFLPKDERRSYSRVL